MVCVAKMGGACLSSCSSSPCLPTSGSALQATQQSPVCRNIPTFADNRGRKLSMSVRVRALNDIVSSAPTTADPSQAQLTWQILVGSLAGVVPFVVAGIEFTKRIVSSFNFKLLAISLFLFLYRLHS